MTRLEQCRIVQHNMDQNDLMSRQCALPLFFMDIFMHVCDCITLKHSIYSDPQCLPIERQNHIITGPHLSQNSRDSTSLQSIVANSRTRYGDSRPSIKIHFDQNNRQIKINQSFYIKSQLISSIYVRLVINQTLV